MHTICKLLLALFITFISVLKFGAVIAAPKLNAHYNYLSKPWNNIGKLRDLIIQSRIDIQLYIPHLLVELENMLCLRLWATFEDYKELIAPADNETQFYFDRLRFPPPTYRNMSYEQLQIEYERCRQYYPSFRNCPAFSMGSFFVKWTLSSSIICTGRSTSSKKAEKDINTHLLLRVFAGFPNEKKYKNCRKFYHGEDISSESYPTSRHHRHQRFVKLDQPNLSNPQLMRSAMNRNMKDFCVDVETSFVAIAKMFLELASYCNLTIIYPKDDTRLDKERLVPTVYPRIFANALNTVRRNVYYESPNLVMITPFDFNFIYCDEPKAKHNRWYDFSVLVQPFKWKVWVLIIICIVISACAISLKNFYMQKVIQTRKKGFVEGIQSGIFSMLSGILSCAPAYFGDGSGTNVFSVKRSITFATWLLSCVLLTNYYNGIMTSLMIQPNGEESLNYLSDLVDNNYSFIFTEGAATVYDSVMGVLELYQEQKKSQKSYRKNKLKPVDYLEILVTDYPKGQVFPDKNFDKTFISRDNVAAFGTWLYCFLIYNRAIKFMESEALQEGRDPSKLKKTCHFGKQMFAIAPLVWGFFPPNHYGLYWAYLNMVENGVDARWTYEFNGLNYAKRVQDRMKVISPTEVEPDPSSKEPKPLGFRMGHLATVVNLSILCYSSCILFFTIEILFGLVWAKQRNVNLFPRREIVPISDPVF